MRCIYKRGRIITDNSGETMVEVLVAFTLLSIMLVIFSQGLAWATRSEVQASRSRNNADEGMKAFQTMYATEAKSTVPVTGLQGPLNGRLRRGTYSYTASDGQQYIYTYYESR